jgi:hypothetical protein
MIRWSYVEVKVMTFEIARRDRVAGAIAENSAGYSIAPVAMIAPWPGRSLGTDAVVPSVPGLVRERVVPSKSETLSFPLRARETTSLAAARNSENRMASAPGTLGTSSDREPSALGTSTARPNRTCGRRTRVGSPPAPSYASFMPGNAWSARITAHETRCVKETFGSSAAARS